VAAAGVLTGVVHCAALDPAAAPPSEAAVAHAARALTLVQALVRTSGREAPRLWLVTQGAQAVRAGAAVAVAPAALWGLGRVVALEHPELRCTRLDVEAGLAPAAAAAAIAAEVARADGEDEVALRGEARHVARLVRGGIAASGPAVVRADGVYVLTGGLGGLGLAFARWLVGAGARRLVLVGRRGASEPAAAAAVAALEAAGATVRVVAADVTERAAMEAVLATATALGPVRGVIHAAGVLDDGLVLSQDGARLARVMGPKVAGAWHLHALTAGAPLDFFVLCSSMAAVLGSPGQANYAAGNACLDALAHARRAAGQPALSIDWGPWAEVGMAAGRSFRGLASLTPAQGTAALGRLLGAGVAQAGVMALEARQWFEVFPAAAGKPLLAALAAEAAAGRPGSGAVRAEVAGLATAAERRRRLVGYLQEEIGQVLGLAAAAVEVGRPIPDMGFDSLLALELKNRLEFGLGIALAPTLVWAYPTIEALVPEMARRMAMPFTVDAPPASAPEADDRERLDDLSDDAVRALLDEELAALHAEFLAD
jgi:myxalamid-type polyketide synthase MxaE and MxaD